MRLGRSAPVAAAAELLLALACDKTPEPLSLTDGPSFAAGGNDNNQKAEGHAVLVSLPTFVETYTFDAKAHKGVYSGHISATFDNREPLMDFFLEGDVTCLVVVPGTTHALVTARVTGGNLDIPYMSWTVTDGGNGSNAQPDAASFIFNDGSEACPVRVMPEEANDQNNITVKP